MTFHSREFEEWTLVFSSREYSAAFLVTGHLRAASHLQEGAK